MNQAVLQVRTAVVLYSTFRPLNRGEEASSEESLNDRDLFEEVEVNDVDPSSLLEAIDVELIVWRMPLSFIIIVRKRRTTLSKDFLNCSVLLYVPCHYTKCAQELIERVFFLFILDIKMLSQKRAQIFGT